MGTPELLTDTVTDTVFEWFTNLDFEYMLLHIVVCYGLYYSENMRWIVEYFSPVRRKGRSRAVWLIGGFLALLEMVRFFPYIGDDTSGFGYDIFISIFHSYIVVQVFVDPIVNFVHKWLAMFKDVADIGMKQKTKDNS
jgi:hypothetical protein